MFVFYYVLTSLWKRMYICPSGDSIKILNLWIFELFDFKTAHKLKFLFLYSYDKLVHKWHIHKSCLPQAKSAHWGKDTITVHPVVCFYRPTPASQLRRHSVVLITEDKVHDHHAVHAFTELAVQDLKKVLAPIEIKKITIFSDGCSIQYKGKGTFAHLSIFKGNAN